MKIDIEEIRKNINDYVILIYIIICIIIYIIYRIEYETLIKTATISGHVCDKGEGIIELTTTRNRLLNGKIYREGYTGVVITLLIMIVSILIIKILIKRGEGLKLKEVLLSFDKYEIIIYVTIIIYLSILVSILINNPEEEKKRYEEVLKKKEEKTDDMEIIDNIKSYYDIDKKYEAEEKKQINNKESYIILDVRSKRYQYDEIVNELEYINSTKINMKDDNNTNMKILNEYKDRLLGNRIIENTDIRQIDILWILILIMMVYLLGYIWNMNKKRVLYVYGIIGIVLILYIYYRKM